MRSRELQSNNKRLRIVCAAAALLLLVTAAAAAFYVRHNGYLVLTDGRSGHEYGRYPLAEGETFSVGFIHSVNKSPLTDYYTVEDGAIYVEKTVYYNFGAGVQTELGDGQTLTYGDDGSMIVSGFHQEMADLVYIVGTVSDHTLGLPGGKEISLRELCGRNAMVRFEWTSLAG